MNDRVVWIDWTRALACFLVMIVHSTEPFYLGGDGLLLLTETDAWWCAFFEGISRACVPMFIIISGYLLLPVKQSAKVFFVRRFKRVVVPFVFWALMYAIFIGDANSNIFNLALNFNYTAGHLWFVYMIIGLYLFMPIISPWIERASKNELLSYMFLCLFTSLMPIIRDVMSGDDISIIYGPTGIPARALYPLWGEASWNVYGMFYYFSGVIGYVLLGAYLKRFCNTKSGKNILKVSVPFLILGFCVCAGGFVYKAYRLGHGLFPLSMRLDSSIDMETTLNNDTVGVALLTIGMILFLMKVTCQGVLYHRMIEPVSKISYGMYLMHMFVLTFISAWLRDSLGVGDGSLGVMTTPIQIILTAVISYAIVAVIAFTIHRIPVIGKWLIG